MAPATASPWWRGARGEWLVIAQAALMGLIFFGPRHVGSAPAWPIPGAVSRAAGAFLLAFGGIFLLWGMRSLGRALTPLPYPKEGGALVRTGAYAFVRHPLYTAGLAIALGWALWVRGWLTLAYGLVLFAVLDAKSRREERWLVERFPEYVDYRRHVRRLLPFVY